MSIKRYAIIPINVKENLDVVLQRLVKIGVDFLLLVKFDESLEATDIHPNLKQHLPLFDSEWINVSSNNLYSAAIEILSSIIYRLHDEKHCFIYIGNSSTDLPTVSVFSILTFFLSNYLAERNRKSRRERFPRFGLIRCIWNENDFFEYPIPLVHSNMLILPHLSSLLEFNEIITSPKILRMIQDSAEEEISISKSTVQNFVNSLIKSLDGCSQFESHATSGFKLNLPISDD